MKISVDDKVILELSETQKKVLCNELMEDNLEKDLIGRLKWVLTHKYEQCFKRLKEEWDPKLKDAKIDMVPTKPEKYAELVFKQKDYKSRKKRGSDMPKHIDNDSDKIKEEV